ncbi:hypothetical protein P8452_19945 [Trifolium repens]|nr:hypothetical protein P8452_19945 [Trifolium repens]
MELNNKEVLVVLALSAKNIPPLPLPPSIQIFLSPLRRIHTSFADSTVCFCDCFYLISSCMMESMLCWCR